MYNAGTIKTFVNYYQPTTHYVLEHHELQCYVVLTNRTEGTGTVVIIMAIPSSTKSIPETVFRSHFYYIYLSFSAELVGAKG